MEDTIHTLTISAIDVRAGDVFVHHRRTWTARHDAHRMGQFTVTVETTNGGVVYFSARDSKVTVQRDMKGLLCDDVTA